MRQAQTGSGLGRRPQCTSENIIDGNYTINYIQVYSAINVLLKEPFNAYKNKL